MKLRLPYQHERDSLPDKQNQASVSFTPPSALSFTHPSALIFVEVLSAVPKPRMLFSFTHPSVLNTSKVTNVFIPGSSSNSEHPDNFFDGEKRQGRSSGGIERFEFEILRLVEN